MTLLTIVSWLGGIPLILLALLLGGAIGFALAARRSSTVSNEDDYELRGLRELRGNLRQQLRESDDTLQARTEELKSNENELSALREQTKRQREQLKALTAQLEQERDRASSDDSPSYQDESLIKELQEKARHIEHLEQDLNHHRTWVQNLEQQLGEHQSKLDSLQWDVKDRKAQLDEANASLAMRNEERAALQAELVAQQTSVAEQAEHLRALSAALSAREKRVAELEQELDMDTEPAPTAAPPEEAELDPVTKSLAQVRRANEDSAEVAKRREQRIAALGAGLAVASRGLSTREGAAKADRDVDPLAAELHAISEAHEVAHGDDLSQIGGIAPRVVPLLAEQGIRNFLQLGLLSSDAQQVLEAKLGLSAGRIARDNWSGQAVELHRAQHQEDLSHDVRVPPSAEAQALAAHGDGDHLARYLRELPHSPEGGEDDLAKIDHLDADAAAALRRHGITTYRQLALLDDAALDALECRLDRLPGELRRANWVIQAAQLHFETYDEALYDQLRVDPVYENEFQKQLAIASRGRRLDYTDDLKKIKGLGPKMAALLNERGLHTYWQLSQLDDAAISDLDADLEGIGARMRRGKWVEQAAELHRKNHAG